MFLARAAAWHVLINASFHFIWQWGGPPYLSEGTRANLWLQSAFRGRNSVGGGGYSLMWETRWCDAAVRLSQFHSSLLRGCQILSSLCEMQNSTDGLEKCATPRATAACIRVLVCMCDHAPSKSLRLFVCLLFLPPRRHQNSSRKDRPCECLRRHGAHERRQSGSRKYNSCLLTMLCSLAWGVCMCVCAYVCASMCLTSLGLRYFPAPTTEWVEKLFRRSGEGEQCGSIQKNGAAAENHWLTSY